MTTFKPKMDSLPKNQKSIWPNLKALTEEGFVLYGGTAIALYLGHRESIDFDFFTNQPVGGGLVQKFSFLKKATIHHQAKDTLILMIPGKPGALPVKLSLFGNIPFSQEGNIKTTDDHVLRVAPLKFLLGTKLKVLFDRVEPKDYIDIAHILDTGLALKTGLKMAQKLFKNSFSPNQAKRTLIYFDLPELEELDPKIKKKLLNYVKQAELNS